MGIFLELLARDRFLRIEHKRTYGDGDALDAHIVSLLDAYLSSYAMYNGLGAEDLSRSYASFVEKYNKDVEIFFRTGEYPLELGASTLSISRIEYDIALIISCLVAPQRREIIRILSRIHLTGFEKVLIVGVGAGLELMILKEKKFALIAAYDPELNNFVREYFPSVQFVEEYFCGKLGLYDAIFAIEVLEHLNDPYELVKQCAASLRPNGRMFITTATNIPQTDHLYNFKELEDTRSKFTEIGLRIKEHVEISQKNKIASRNDFFVLTLSGMQD